MENLRKRRDLKLVTTDNRRSQLVSEPNYHTTICFSEDLLAINLKNTSNYEDDRPLPKGMNKIPIGLMKDEIGGKIIREYVALRPKWYSYLTDDDKVLEKLKEQKNV